ncbi:MAG: LysM peptidoglycan-binding domain-containing protein [Anaerolineaceae bacterium]
MSPLELTALPEQSGDDLSTPIPTRPAYQPGQLVDYTAQTGDTLPALASHFNTTVEEIRETNPIIPSEATTMPPGLPMKIPIYFESLWGSPYQIIPDSLFINGPAQIGFDPVEFVNNQPGWFKNYSEFAGTSDRKGGELIQYVAENFSISPRLLLVIIEYQTQALSQPNPSDPTNLYPLGYKEINHKGLYRQLVWAANALNNGYYGWRDGSLKTFDHSDGRLERPDPWQNAATVGLSYYFSHMLPKEQYQQAVSHMGFAALYEFYFGSIWENVLVHIPGSLAQPPLNFPFLPGKTWAYTGGPHTGWGEGSPWAALDFAPPAVVGGCVATNEWATAISDGYIVRSGNASAVIDIDGDHDEHTGWVIFYLHLANEGRISQGMVVSTGDKMGHPSCEGGTSTGTHVHIARKYNGEWIAAGGPLPFNLEGWTAIAGNRAYQGKLVRFSREITASVVSDNVSLISAGKE